MFNDVGWGEIFLLFVVGLVVIGPERLPRVVQDIKAALTAARTAINNAKQGIDEELGSEFDDIRKPLSELASLQRLGPKAALTKTLLDGDSSFLDALDPKKIMDEAPEEAERKKTTRPDDEQPQGGGFSWADIT